MYILYVIYIITYTHHILTHTHMHTHAHTHTRTHTHTKTHCTHIYPYIMNDAYLISSQKFFIAVIRK